MLLILELSDTSLYLELPDSSLYLELPDILILELPHMLK